MSETQQPPEKPVPEPEQPPVSEPVPEPVPEPESSNDLPEVDLTTLLSVAENNRRRTEALEWIAFAVDRIAISLERIDKKMGDGWGSK